MRATLGIFFGLCFKAIATVILTLLLLEGGVRIILSYSLNNYFTKTLPQPYGKIMQNIVLFDCLNARRVNRFDPFCYFIPNTGFFRGPNGRVDCPKEKGPHEIRIICIGDSTTFGGMVGYYDSWVYLLGKMLAAQYPEKNIRVLNAGLPGASPRQIKRYFQFYLVSYHPDILIWRGGSALTDTYFVNNDTSNAIRFFIWRCLYESRLFRALCVFLDQNRKNDVTPAASIVYDFLTNRSPNLQPPAGKFDSDFSMVKKIAEEHGTRYALEVEYLNRGSRGVLGSEFEGPNHKGPEPAVHVLTVFEAYKKNNPSKDLFVDQVHLTERGEALTAQEISKFIIGNKWIETFH